MRFWLITMVSRSSSVDSGSSELRTIRELLEVTGKSGLWWGNREKGSAGKRIASFSAVNRPYLPPFSLIYIYIAKSLLTLTRVKQHLPS
jgi:hypothetical protein